MKLSPGLKQFVKEHETDDVHSLALQAGKYPDIDMETAIRQIKGRRIAKDKIPSWYAAEDIIYPRHLSLEQSSSEATAIYKRSLCKGNIMADLTGGMGVDISFLSADFEQAIYIEQQEELAEIATHNFNILGLDNITAINADGVNYLSVMQPVDLIYIDPARRDDTGKKTVRIEDCTPNILDIEDLLEKKSGMAMIKLSPMLDISLALNSLRNISDVHIVAVNNEVKELLFMKQKDAGQATYHCVNILKDNTEEYTFQKEDENSASVSYSTQIYAYLYEANASIMKGGAYKSIANSFSLEKLHPSSHLYTSDVLQNDFPGRKFIVKTVCSLNKKDIKEHLSGLKQANITVRNFPLSVQEIRKKTGLKEGGEVYIFATTLFDERKVLIICEKA
ncbi:16S rRNA G966 N2-methylase RsmD [Dysgonomonas hofstadii]|uniref:16S rRNA G966 N2-methylase RsmD n=1 Tax=Dysgonomonas hofstadii TaxID=637886 RepID=A0A840CH79_9BACT|nr:SAM-dependent methyltransferase [Dysgonomonas hofstadii]MBB4035300.1 16S rRNA G966 N2-methylase RsmD [Dysgonomonas hofstadii]